MTEQEIRKLLDKQIKLNKIAIECEANGTIRDTDVAIKFLSAVLDITATIDKINCEDCNIKAMCDNER